MRKARKKLRLCSHARVVGVAFFDFKHGQTGRRPKRDRASPDPQLSLPDYPTSAAAPTSASRHELRRIVSG
jgi:hypothetical protein